MPKAKSTNHHIDGRCNNYHNNSINDVIRSLVKHNIDYDGYVIVTHNKEHFETLRDILVELGFGPAAPISIPLWNPLLLVP